jgi:hypothetical protein
LIPIIMNIVFNCCFRTHLPPLLKLCDQTLF